MGLSETRVRRVSEAGLLQGGSDVASSLLGEQGHRWEGLRKLRFPRTVVKVLYVLIRAVHTYLCI